MDFYTQMSIHYDDIFKFSRNKLIFLMETLPSGAQILDVGCGTGTYSVPLAMEGYHLVATDLDESMLKRAEANYNRMKSEHSHLNGGSHLTQVMNLKDLEKTIQPNQMFNLIYCIGNTLPHVNEKEAIEFIKTCINHLPSGGRLVLQFVNYEKALLQLNTAPVLTFPPLKFGENMQFERRYQLISDAVLGEANILFEACFANGEEKGPEKKALGETKLLGITKNMIESWLVQLDCSNYRFYGDFDRNPYTIESPALIVELIQ